MPNQFAARDANNNIVTLESLPTVGPKSNNACLPVTLSTEQNTTLSAIASSVAGTLAVSGAFWQTTQPISIDQTTPGTSNLVQVGDSLPTGLNTIGYVGGISESLSMTPTLNAGAYSSGMVVGGLLTFGLFRSTTRPGGLLNQIWMASKGGVVTPHTFYVFRANPTASTITDHTAFVLATTDIDKLAMPPFVFVPALIGVGTTAKFVGTAPAISIKNADSPLTTNLHIVVVVGGAQTYPSTTDVIVGVNGVPD